MHLTYNNKCINVLKHKKFEIIEIVKDTLSVKLKPAAGGSKSLLISE